MAIQEITSTELVQRCAKCDGENRIALASLEVGIEREDQVQDDILSLPECPTCHSREFLIRSPADEQQHPLQQGGAGLLHRLLVDDLHAELVSRGQVVARLRDQAEKVLTRPLGTETLQRFFDKGLKMPARAVEQLQGKEPGQ